MITYWNVKFESIIDNYSFLGTKDYIILFVTFSYLELYYVYMKMYCNIAKYKLI